MQLTLTLDSASTCRRVVLLRPVGIKGQVRGTGPVPDATVSVLIDGVPVAFATSDQDGRFEIDAPSSGLHVVRARKPSVGTASTSVVFVDWSNCDYVTLQLCGLGRLSGIVVDTNGQALGETNLWGLHDEAFSGIESTDGLLRPASENAYRRECESGQLKLRSRE